MKSQAEDDESCQHPQRVQNAPWNSPAPLKSMQRESQTLNIEFKREREKSASFEVGHTIDKTDMSGASVHDQDARKRPKKT
ncbi:hypothetical protein OG21DRAFT_1516884 [Imleria badia]|nr:hypothetical protein OG21DRAFT_1516884 [Imleria badia]